MNKATLKYKIFNKTYFSEFRKHSENKYLSQDNLFELKFTRKKDKAGNLLFSGSLSWIDHQRPSIGLFILDLKVELDITEPIANLKILQHGYQSWSFTSSYASEQKDVSPKLLKFLRYGQENIYTDHPGKPGNFISEGVLLAHSKTENRGFILGVNEVGNQNTKFQILWDKQRITSLAIIYDFYCTPEFKLNSPVELTQVKYEAFSEIAPELVLEEYGVNLGKKYKVKPSSEDVPTGWCSWYYYYTKISEEIILSNLHEIKTRKLPIEFFQIDDGYQNEIGDWTVVNEKFPRGVRFLAEEIKKQDLRPGIWLAPFLVRKKSSFFTLYPEAVLKDAKGNPVAAIWNPLWGFDYTYTLDVTHPKSIEFLETLFQTFTRDYGYNYLKLDFLFSASLQGVPYNKRLTPAERYRQALELIRKVVGKNTFLLGCGAPLIPSIGIFDGMRIGCDVTPFWYPEIKRRLLSDKHALSTEKGLINTINRSFMHRNWWLNDPDCLIVRKEKNKMNPAQTILMATVMAMSGGILLVSDNLVTIEQDRIEILEKTLQLSKLCQGKRSIPLGMFGGSFPRGFINEAGFFAVWNPSEKDEWIELDIPIKIKLNDTNDYWTNEKIYSLEIDNTLGKIKVMLKPFQAIVIGIKN